MRAIVVTDQAAGTAGMKLVARPEPLAVKNDVIVQIHTSGFAPTGWCRSDLMSVYEIVVEYARSAQGPAR